MLRVNKTAMLSTYTCIYGNGCKGVKHKESDPNHANGCCTHGAFITDLKDYKAVLAQADRLTDEDWELKRVGERIGPFHDMRSARQKQKDAEGIDRMADEDDESFGVKTRVYKGTCIFANRGKDGKYGCAFHHMAMRLNEDYSKVKPFVCVEVPVIVEREYDENNDGETITVDLRSKNDWNETGDMPYWCVDDPDAYVVTSTPAYINLESELRLSLGDRDYDLMRAALESLVPFSMPASPNFLPIVETS